MVKDTSGNITNPSAHTLTFFSWSGLLETQLTSGYVGPNIYPQSKLVALLGTHWWRRELTGQCTVVAVSPGLIPGTGLGKGSGRTIPTDLPDAKSVPEGPSFPL
jgi:hypothetical protein